MEISLDGAIAARRRINGDVEAVLGRIRGIDYVLTRSLSTQLDRIHDGARQLQIAVNGTASFNVAPDGNTMAWIELGQDFTAGRLRLSTLPELVSRQGPTLLDNAWMVGWSPDGRSLAVLVDEDSGDAASASPRVIVIDRGGHVLRRLPLDRLERMAAPVWLDDHRIAVLTGERTTYRWFDLRTGEQGDVVDREHGSTYWLTRSPRDGTLAMWRMGTPGTLDAHTEHLYVQRVGHQAEPLHVDEAYTHLLVPSWSAAGDLLVRALDTGVVSRVALDTGKLTPIATLSETPQDDMSDDHVVMLPDGDLLAVDIELSVHVAVARPDGPAPYRRGGALGGPL
jgi:hypothetical protein